VLNQSEAYGQIGIHIEERLRDAIKEKTDE